MFFSPAGNNIPATAIIRGIQVDIVRMAGVASSIRDEDVFLLKAGVATGSDHANTGTDWGTSDGTATYGSSSDLWGTTWTAAQINANNFGVRLRVRNATRLVREHRLGQPHPRDRHVHLRSDARRSGARGARSSEPTSAARAR